MQAVLIAAAAAPLWERCSILCCCHHSLQVVVVPQSIPCLLFASPCSHARRNDLEFLERTHMRHVREACKRILFRDAAQGSRNGRTWYP